MFAVKISTSHE